MFQKFKQALAVIDKLNSHIDSKYEVSETQLNVPYLGMKDPKFLTKEKMNNILAVYVVLQYYKCAISLDEFIELCTSKKVEYEVDQIIKASGGKDKGRKGWIWFKYVVNNVLNNQQAYIDPDLTIDEILVSIKSKHPVVISLESRLVVVTDVLTDPVSQQPYAIVCHDQMDPYSYGHKKYELKKFWSKVRKDRALFFEEKK